MFWVKRELIILAVLLGSSFKKKNQKTEKVFYRYIVGRETVGSFQRNQSQISLSTSQQPCVPGENGVVAMALGEKQTDPRFSLFSQDGVSYVEIFKDIPG